MASPSYELAHCIVCGHAEASVIADADVMRIELEALWAYHERRLRPGVPSPRLVDRVAFSERPPLRLVRCTECGLVYRNPVERPYELTEIYANETPPADVLRSLHDTQRPALRAQARSVRAALGRVGSGLEVGSYVGAFLGAAREEGLQFEGLDINASVNVFTRSMGFTVHDGELATFTTAQTFDAVAIWNTFDQLADPRGPVNAAWKVLRPGGVLAIRVPNGGFYAAVRTWLSSANPFRSSTGRALLAQNNLLTFPYRWGFTPRSLARLLDAAGFDVGRTRGDVLVPVGDEWTKGWARIEEMVIKRLLGPFAAATAEWAPWFEVYAARR